MVTVKQVVEQALTAMKTYSLQRVLPALREANEGAKADVLNTNGNAYYQWSACLVDILKPKQVVELGGAMGVWDLLVLDTLPATSKLYSITMPENGLEFSYVVDKYPNFHPIIGDDLDMNNWKDIDLSMTNLWFFDTVHTEDQLRKELDLYSPFFKKDAVVLFDDIHLHEGMENVWKDIKAGKWGTMDCYDGTNPLHYTGFGCARIS